MISKRLFIALPALASLCLTSNAQAALSTEELAKLAQNPVGNLVSIPFQNNTNTNVGPEKKNQNILNIQPVIPVSINEDWNVITRTILPVISQPALSPYDDRTNGVGDIQFSAFLSPAEPGHWIWGVGSIIQAPTNTHELGNDNWGAGPTAVLLRIEKGNPWVYGALVNNIWSVSADQRGGSYNNGLIQPFLNYNFEGGFYLTSAPVITANWNAEESDDVWTVPVGGGVGKIFHLGRLPVNTQLSAYKNVERPEYGADWQYRVQVQFLFPK